MIKRDNICLRALRASDWNILYQAINNPELVRYNAPFKPVHESEHTKWFDNITQDTSKSFYIIELFDEPIGSIQLIDIQPVHRSAELTIRLFSKKNYGKGVGTSAVQLLCEYAFQDLGLVRVWLRVFLDNKRAIHCYKKAGFLEEGKMRSAAYVDGEYKDVMIMSRLKNDKIQ